jgi:hypothetical protein
MEKSRIRDREKHPGSATRKKFPKKLLPYHIKFIYPDLDLQLEKMLDPDPH